MSEGVLFKYSCVSWRRAWRLGKEYGVAVDLNRGSQWIRFVFGFCSSCPSRTGRPQYSFLPLPICPPHSIIFEIGLCAIGDLEGYEPVTVSLLAVVVLGRVLGLCGAQARSAIGISRGICERFDVTKIPGATYWPS